MKTLSRLGFATPTALALLLATGYAQAKGVDASAAERCKALDKCAYVYDVYDGTPKFRNAIKTAFTAVHIAQPSWIKKGVATPMIPVVIDGNSYLLGTICEPHNCPHQLLILYSPASASISAIYDDGNGNLTYLGNLSGKQKQVLSDYKNTESSLNKALENPKTLPVVIR